MRLLGGELLKLARRPATYISLAVLLGILAVLFLSVGASYGMVSQLPAEQGGGAQTQEAIRSLLRFPEAYRGLVQFIVQFGGLVGIAYGAAASGGDWGWGMVKVAVSRGESRSRYIITKLVAVAILLVPATVIAFLVGIVAVVLAATMAGLGTAGLGDTTTLGTLPWLLARCWLGLVEQAAIGFAIATVARSQLAGLGVGIGVYFVESFAVTFWPEYIKYFPFSVVNSLMSDSAAALAGSALVSRFTIDQGLALALVVTYAVAAAAISAVFLERAEITG